MTKRLVFPRAKPTIETSTEGARSVGIELQDPRYADTKGKRSPAAGALCPKCGGATRKSGGRRYCDHCGPFTRIGEQNEQKSEKLAGKRGTVGAD